MRRLRKKVRSADPAEGLEKMGGDTQAEGLLAVNCLAMQFPGHECLSSLVKPPAHYLGKKKSHEKRPILNGHRVYWIERSSGIARLSELAVRNCAGRR